MATHCLRHKLISAEELYIDVARVDAEGRVEKMKEEMSHWLEEAVKKAPCLLVLDGLDTLLAPENEVCQLMAHGRSVPPADILSCQLRQTL